MNKTQALAKAARQQAALNTAERKATDAALSRDAAMADARDEGATYSDLQNATGLSVARVTQILRRVREVRASTNA